MSSFPNFYALKDSVSKKFVTNVSFDFDDEPYRLDSLKTIIFNDPELRFNDTSNWLAFRQTIPSGEDAVFVSFPSPRSGVLVVTFNLNVPENGGLYVTAISGVSPEGFGVLFSDFLDGDGLFAFSIRSIAGANAWHLDRCNAIKCQEKVRNDGF